MKAGLLSHEDISLASGTCAAALFLCYQHRGALPAADAVGLFRAALALYKRVELFPLPAEWWSSTCDVVDVTSARLNNLWAMFAVVLNEEEIRSDQCGAFHTMVEIAKKSTMTTSAISS